jgi:hypothetical protein
MGFKIILSQSLNDLKDLINDLNAFLEIFFSKNYLFDMIVAPCKTNKALPDIQIVILLYHY